MRALDSERWGIILAGGEGARLRPLTRAICGDDRPKQFCPILGDETMLERTRRRAALAIPPERTLIALTRAHERFYAPLQEAVPSRCLVVQPEERGTAPAILYAVARVGAAAPRGFVAILPSDHWVSDDARFMRHVDAAFAAAAGHPELLVLLGISPESPEVEYGWIEPGVALPASSAFPARRVHRFWEKPSRAVAEALFRRNGLWNAFVLVAWVPALLAAFRAACPDLYRGFAAIRGRLGMPEEGAVAEAVYARLASSSFSREVLCARPAALAVLTVSGVLWSDWGRPARVVETLARSGLRPRWAGAAVAAAL